MELDRFHFNMLWSACRNGYAVAAMYLSSYFDPNERDLDYGSTPLHLLFKIPEPYMDKVAETLVACGADPNLSTNKKIPYIDQESHLILQGTPLDWSIKAGSKKAVQCLLAVGADPLAFGMEMTPLCRAVSLYRSDIIRCIMDRIGPIEKLMTTDMTLCKVGFEIVYGFGPQLSAECERAILYGDDNKHAANKALDAVLEYMREDTSQFLDILLFQTLTPEVQYTTVVPVPYLTELFIEKGAHVVLRFATGSRPMLHRLAELWIRDGDNCEALLESLLLRFPDEFDLNVRDSGGRTALHEAAIYNAYPLIPILLKHGADINAEDRDHCTPLALAGCMASVQAFELLLDNGATIQLQDGNVLHQSCIARNPTSIIPFALLKSAHRHRLLQNDILEGVMTSVQTTPLGIAVHNGDVEAVTVLLQCGANPRAAFNIPGWGVVISIREDATLLRHRPELSEIIYTWQRREWVGQDQRVVDIRKIQKMLYRNCPESDYEEPDMMHISLGKSQPFVLLQTRPRRQGEWYTEGFVSIDVLGQTPSRVGCSMWDEIDLREDEHVEHRMMMLAPRSGPGQQVEFIIF
jgi:ankyrin repeat protein